MSNREKLVSVFQWTCMVSRLRDALDATQLLLTHTQPERVVEHHVPLWEHPHGCSACFSSLWPIPTWHFLLLQQLCWSHSCFTKDVLWAHQESWWCLFCVSDCDACMHTKQVKENAFSFFSRSLYTTKKCKLLWLLVQLQIFCWFSAQWIFL